VRYRRAPVPTLPKPLAIRRTFRSHCRRVPLDATTSIGGADTVDAFDITFDYTEGPSATPATYGEIINATGNGLSSLSDPVLVLLCYKH
jgi:hypothetical protein